MAQLDGIIIDHARPRDLNCMADIFIASLPGHQLSLLGFPVCREYLLHTLEDDAFITMTAREDGHPVGFLVLNVDVVRKPSRIYYYRHWHRLAGAILRRPILLPKWGFAVLRGSWRRRVASRRKDSRERPAIHRSAWIEYVVVSPPHRRRGIATALIRSVLDCATYLGKETLLLATARENRMAIGAYQRMGFRQVERGGKQAEFIFMGIPVTAGEAQEGR